MYGCSFPEESADILMIMHLTIVCSEQNKVPS